MDIQQLIYFKKLAQTGNYLNAADDLEISQSQLSKKIMKLEAELGVELIDRSKRKISLSKAGEVTLSHGEKLLEDFRHMQDELAIFRQADDPVLRILAMTMLAPYRIPQIISGFSKVMPEIEINILESNPEGSYSDFEKGEVELGFAREEFIDLDRFEHIRICEDEIVVIVNKDHYISSRRSIHLNDLKHEEFVFPGRKTLFHKYLHGICTSSGFEPHIIYESIHNQNVLELVVAGTGPALVLRKIMEHRDDPRIALVPLDQKFSTHLSLVWLKGHVLSPQAAHFIEYFKENYTF